MRLTTKGRFAVTAMIDLALRQQSGPVTLSAISQRQNISLSYLEQLFGKLRRHAVVEHHAILAAHDAVAGEADLEGLPAVDVDALEEFGGVAALLAMLNSCASGVSVMNIDNGFGAAAMASAINHLRALDRA
mgnify:CR=1 FL=1